MNPVISSLAFLGKPVEEIISICEKNEWSLEFSSGMPYRENMEKVFLETNLIKYAHNYFPAPRIPFVLNLASTNEEIRCKSIEHCIRGIELSSKVKAPFFSAHAGFCIDPSPEELGKQLRTDKSFNKEDNWKAFKNSLHVILKKAAEHNIKFLVENNVIAKMNLLESGKNPLLCCEIQEIQELFREMKNPSLGLLLDTAHWKVSANTLRFDLLDCMKIKQYVQCLHHSDNEGEFDNNLSLNEDYWFLPLMKHFTNAIHVLEVKKLTEDEIRKQFEILIKN